MESDFVTQQHVESLGVHDPHLSEVLNRYKFSPSFPTANQPVNGFSGFQGGQAMGHSDAMLLSNMLGQIQAGLNRGNPNNFGSDGFQLNINSDVLKWVVLLLLVLLLVWLFLKSMKTGKRKNPLKKRLDQVEDQLKELKALKGKTKKSVNIDTDEED